MQKLISFSTILFLLFIFSCSKDKTTLPDNTISPPKLFLCDSTVTYTKYIRPIFISNCGYSGCHSAPYPAGGIYLTDYLDSKLQVQNDNLIADLKHEFGYPPMPYPIGTPALPDSVIAIVQCWKDHGCPE